MLWLEISDGGYLKAVIRSFVDNSGKQLNQDRLATLEMTINGENLLLMKKDKALVKKNVIQGSKYGY